MITTVLCHHALHLIMVKLTNFGLFIYIYFGINFLYCFFSLITSLPLSHKPGLGHLRSVWPQGPPHLLSSSRVSQCRMEGPLLPSTSFRGRNRPKKPGVKVSSSPQVNKWLWEVWFIFWYFLKLKCVMKKCAFVDRLVINGLEPYTEYSVRLAVKNSHYQGNFSTEQMIFTQSQREYQQDSLLSVHFICSLSTIFDVDSYYEYLSIYLVVLSDPFSTFTMFKYSLQISHKFSAENVKTSADSLVYSPNISF